MPSLHGTYFYSPTTRQASILRIWRPCVTAILWTAGFTTPATRHRNCCPFNSSRTPCRLLRNTAKPAMHRKIISSPFSTARNTRLHSRFSIERKVNRELKTLGEQIGMEMPLTTYVARHTFATVLKRSGVNIAIISESLGHSDLSTTQIYLDSFENSQIDAAMQNLL